jgi:hypothetical protein
MNKILDSNAAFILMIFVAATGILTIVIGAVIWGSILISVGSIWLGALVISAGLGIFVSWLLFLAL